MILVAKNFIISLVILAVLFAGLPALAYAQETSNCDEALLRDLSVAMLNCTGEGAPSGCGGGSLIGNDNAEKAFNFFASKPGYEPYHAAGIVGNMMIESGVLPQRLQGTGTDVITAAAEVGNRNLGWGIVQWTPGSKMINPVTAAGKDPNDLAVQLDFLWNQLEGNPPLSEKRAGDEIKATTTVEEAVKAFQGTRGAGGQYYGYERPADQSGSILERTAFAIDVLTQFGSGTSTVGNGTGCELDASGCPTGPISEAETVLAAGVRVHPCIAPEVERIVALAKAQGLATFRGDGWVSKEIQEQKRANNGCAGREYDESCKASPPTAIPGESRHERGTAIDFYCDGNTIPNHSHPCFVFLQSNTKLKNLDSEAWHWSIDGG